MSAALTNGISESKTLDSTSPHTTLVVMLGASSWPKHQSLDGSEEAFKNSGNELIEYFLSVSGMGISPKNLLNLFDSEQHVDWIVEEIENFLKTRITALKKSGTPARDLIVIYIGHGSFIQPEQAYSLALRSTRKEAEDTSALRVSSLARVINQNTHNIRRYLILDSCFAAAAHGSFQSPILEVMRIKTEEVFPSHGTALLCATSAMNFAIIPTAGKYTMFSGALLRVLKSGIAHKPNRLSIADIGQAVWDLLKETYQESAVRPEVHRPNQKSGDVAAVPIFPNANKMAPPARSPIVGETSRSLMLTVAVLMGLVLLGASVSLSLRNSRHQPSDAEETQRPPPTPTIVDLNPDDRRNRDSIEVGKTPATKSSTSGGASNRSKNTSVSKRHNQEFMVNSDIVVNTFPGYRIKLIKDGRIVAEQTAEGDKYELGGDLKIDKPSVVRFQLSLAPGRYNVECTNGLNTKRSEVESYKFEVNCP